jgi:hypothetical protein
VLAAQTHGDEGSQATDNDAFGVDEDPLLLDIGGKVPTATAGFLPAFPAGVNANIPLRFPASY